MVLTNQLMRKIFSNYVCFSKSPNFTNVFVCFLIQDKESLKISELLPQLSWKKSPSIANALMSSKSRFKPLFCNKKCLKNFSPKVFAVLGKLLFQCSNCPSIAVSSFQQSQQLKTESLSSLVFFRNLTTPFSKI